MASSMLKCWEHKNCQQKNCVVFVKNHNKSTIPHCWLTAGTLCDGKVSGDYNNKINYCRKCDYYTYLQGKLTLRKRSLVTA